MLKVGDKIKTFEVKSIEKSWSYSYTNRGQRIKNVSEYALLLSDKGQERVLRCDLSNLNQCETWTTTFGSKKKFISWDMLEVL